MQDKILRMIDANINRATEGLRVAEDVVRFVLDDDRSTLRLKHARHEIVRLLRGVRGKGQGARDVKGDVGAKRSTKSEGRRKNILDVFLANIKRAEESVRVFEETLKLFDPKLSPKFKKLRFELYDIEQKTSILLTNKIKLDSPLYIITDSSYGYSHLHIMKEAAKAGAKIFQYRDKRSGIRGKVKTAQKLSDYAKAHGLAFIVNDDLDIAKKVDADGVHVGIRDWTCLPAGRELEIRNWQRQGKIIGISASNMREALKAQALGADYVGFGPVFKTPIKPDIKPTGIKELNKVVRKLHIPVVAIGGVCARTIGSVIASGAASGAVIRYVSASTNIKKAVRGLLKLAEVKRP